MSQLSPRATEIVERLWKEVATRQTAEATAVAELGPTSRMIHDPEILYFNKHSIADLQDLVSHLVPVLNRLAERRDELVAELRLLREAIVAESERLAERDAILHALLESRLEALESARPGQA